MTTWINRGRGRATDELDIYTRTQHVVCYLRILFNIDLAMNVSHANTKVHKYLTFTVNNLSYPVN